MLTVVIGPPAAGKTTWVKANARPGDIVIDQDRIAAALTVGGHDGWDHDRRLRSIAYRARQGAINEALRHLDHLDVYLIHTNPTAETLATYRQHGASIVTIDPGRDVVTARCESERPRSARVAVERWYAQHGDTVRQHASTSRNW